MGDSRSFGLQAPAQEHLVRGAGGLSGEITDLRADTDTGFIAVESEIAAPAVAQAHIQLDVQATEGDLITIGADKYEFVDALGNGVEAGAIEVLVGGSAANQRTNLIAAINRTATIGTNASGHGTENIRASLYNTDFLRIEAAKFPGGPANPGPKPNIALSEALTDTATWDHQNLGRTGGDNPLRKTLHVIDVDAINLAADFDVVVPGTPVAASVVLVTDAADVPDGTGKAGSILLTIVQARNAVTVDLNGGATDPVATDKVYLEITHFAG